MYFLILAHMEVFSELWVAMIGSNEESALASVQLDIFHQPNEIYKKICIPVGVPTTRVAITRCQYADPTPSSDADPLPSQIK